MAENKVNKHLHNAQKKLQKNFMAGGQSPSSIAVTNGTNGKNANCSKNSRASARVIPTTSSATSKSTPNPKSILQTLKKKKRQNNVSFASDADTSGPATTQPTSNSSKKKKQQKKQNRGNNNANQDAPNSDGNAGKRKQKRSKN